MSSYLPYLKSLNPFLPLTPQEVVKISEVEEPLYSSEIEYDKFRHGYCNITVKKKSWTDVIFPPEVFGRGWMGSEAVIWIEGNEIMKISYYNDIEFAVLLRKAFKYFKENNISVIFMSTFMKKEEDNKEIMKLMGFNNNSIFENMYSKVIS